MISIGVRIINALINTPPDYLHQTFQQRTTKPKGSRYPELNEQQLQDKIMNSPWEQYEDKEGNLRPGTIGLVARIPGLLGMVCTEGLPG